MQEFGNRGAMASEDRTIGESSWIEHQPDFGTVTQGPRTSASVKADSGIRCGSLTTTVLLAAEVVYTCRRIQCKGQGDITGAKINEWGRTNLGDWKR